MWDAEKRTAAALAAQYRALAALHELDGSYEEAAELDDVDPLRAALALRVTKNAASWQLRDAHQAVHLFPRALEMLESGAMPSAWFQKMLKSSRPSTIPRAGISISLSRPGRWISLPSGSSRC
ncbi:hypothetical protein H3H54_14225 [Brachybacterium sp. Z12]|uniref:hypothetical protein n=1 Tax=Brachybacterium sp. Z12 TaxID=2759167 RepID=UPI001862D84D|nr:hypothetical protein [Brachybacterium sp. Z12]QNN82232.1 hypothetical protein H3H54_14225 [Brachybacterium sp. Z12]